MNKFKWCFIGTGSLAKQVASQLNKSGLHEIVSCYTRDYQKGEKFAKKFGGTAYDTAEKAITAEGVEGVYVVTPHNAHYRYVKKALELGKPVLCEKAFTVTATKLMSLLNSPEKKIYTCAKLCGLGFPHLQIKQKNGLMKINQEKFIRQILLII